MASEDLCPNPGKESWPELVGTNGNEAVKVIERENSKVDAETVPKGSMVTTDFRCDRVFVWLDAHGNVDRVPTIG